MNFVARFQAHNCTKEESEIKINFFRLKLAIMLFDLGVLLLLFNSVMSSTLEVFCVYRKVSQESFNEIFLTE